MPIKAGTDVVGIGSNEIDNIIPVIQTVSKTLVPGVDRHVHVDPSGGAVALTLPDATTNAGVAFYVKRIVDGGNEVKVVAAGSDTIGSAGVFEGHIANRGEWVEYISNGSTNWQLKNSFVHPYASIQGGADTFAITTSPQKLTTFSVNTFTYLGRLVADSANNKITPQNGNLVQSGFDIKASLNCEYTNNNTINAQMYIDGSPVGIPISETGQGSGKPKTLNIVGTFAGLGAIPDIEMYVWAENAGTLTQNGVIVSVLRIGE